MLGVVDDATVEYDPIPIIRLLTEYRVEFIVIGGLAAGVQGAEWLTRDVDIVYAQTRENYQRLASALQALDAEPVGLPRDVHLSPDARALRAGDLWTLSTRLGRLDLMREPAPGLSYEVLSGRARTIHGAETYRVASIDDLITMKQHAGRPKDIGHLEILRAVADVLSEEDDAGSKG
jgi:hypothetical protein